jgi:two-component system, NtrC family, sensor histidine kinase KinB
MKIKKKLLLGFGLLFIITLVFGGVSLYYIEVISNASNVTLKNNYQTLTFTKEMRSVLDENDLPFPSPAVEAFDRALKKQENNITEPWEREATGGVRRSFGLLTGASPGLALQREAEKNIRSLLTRIDGLNMHAIVLKNNKTRSTVTTATRYLGGMAFITFCILFVLIANFPGFILNPLEKFTEALEDISDQNYNARLDFKTSDEFARLAGAFNTMAAKLGALDNANRTKILAEEARIKTLIENAQDMIIGINENEEVLFMNETARSILNLGDKPVTGITVKELPKITGLLKEIIENKDKETPLKIKRGEKITYYEQKAREITVPNLKVDFDSFEPASYSAGIIYVLKQATGTGTKRQASVHG